jgi:hypothetical protein
MNQQMNQERLKWGKRNRSYAKGLWKMDIALMRRSVNSHMALINCERIINSIPSIKPSNVVASKTSSFASMEIDAISSTLVFLTIH